VALLFPSPATAGMENEFGVTEQVAFVGAPVQVSCAVMAGVKP
jgi:hypothetical protein